MYHHGRRIKTPVGFPFPTGIGGTIMATLKELSERTGYSSATISRILSGDPTLSVTEQTRRIVLEEAGRINYIATRSKRGRMPRKSVRVAVAEMLTPVQQLDDPYFLYLSNSVRLGCLDRKYTFIPLEHRGDGFFADQTDNLTGIIAIGKFTPPQIDYLASLSVNVVFVDSSPRESRFDSVVLGYELGISLALEHLFNLGHRRIGYVGPYDDVLGLPEPRRQYFDQIMQKRGLWEPDLVLECSMDAEATKKAFEQFWHSGTQIPTAFLCGNEENAIGTLAALREAGLSVPDDVSVVSFNNTPKSALIEPALTSVSAHVEEMGKVALRMLRERAHVGGADPIRRIPMKVIVPPSITVRKSTGPVKNNCT